MDFFKTAAQLQQEIDDLVRTQGNLEKDVKYKEREIEKIVGTNNYDESHKKSLEQQVIYIEDELRKVAAKIERKERALMRKK